MGLFGFGKKKKVETASEQPKSNMLENRDKYGEAWLLIVGQTQKERGLQLMRELDSDGFIEGTVALSMFCDDIHEKRALVKKAADAGNVEALWQYTAFLPHSYIPDPNNAEDALWEKYCLEAAEKGNADAMNEMGNVFRRREHYIEAMYWYAMANAHDHPQGAMSMNGIAEEWKNHGCPRYFKKGSPHFDRARHDCALSYLEANAGEEISCPPDTMKEYVVQGVALAGYFIGDAFEQMGNYQTAYTAYYILTTKFDDAHATKCCADMQFAGKGIEKDVQNAFYLMIAAAEGGDVPAMFAAGEFMKGQSKKQAAYWYGLSHSRGYGPSLQRLIQLAQ